MAVSLNFHKSFIEPEHRWAAYVAFVYCGEIFVSQHLAMPFGARASVHAWDRIGSLLAFLAQTLLMLPVLRFVDDYFSIELPRAAEHGMQCFARLVRCLLGLCSFAAHKLCCGNPLPVLGLTVTILPGSMSCVPMPDKGEVGSGTLCPLVLSFLDSQASSLVLWVGPLRVSFTV